MLITFVLSFLTGHIRSYSESPEITDVDLGQDRSLSLLTRLQFLGMHMSCHMTIIYYQNEVCTKRTLGSESVLQPIVIIDLCNLGCLG